MQQGDDKPSASGAPAVPGDLPFLDDSRIVASSQFRMDPAEFMAEYGLSPSSPLPFAEEQSDPDVGLLGEFFAFEQLRAILPNFDETCWVSDARREYGFVAPGNDALGYDFRYYDHSGHLTGLFHAAECLIEVKASKAGVLDAFHVSMNEWNTALDCHRTDGRRIYILLLVADVLGSPRFDDLLVDPFELYRQRRLKLRASDLIVTVRRLGGK